MLSEKDVQKGGKSRCKLGIARSGARSESRTRARESRKRCEPESSILSSLPKKLARARGRAWPSPARWSLTNTVEQFTSKLRRGRARPLSFAFPRMARHLPSRWCPRETHFVRG